VASVGLNRVVLAALVAGLTTAGAAFGAESPPTHPERDYAGSGLAIFHVAPKRAARPAGLPGLDVSSWQGNVDWPTVAANGARFAFVKATEGTSYVNPYFGQQYLGAYFAGLVRGAYHFGLPDRSTGAAQAQWFAANGGSWVADGQTLPGALDIEYNPYGAACYGLTPTAMVSWLTSFVTQYQVLTGRSPIIYTTTNWWQTCTGNYPGFAVTVPLWIACWCQAVGQLPAGWTSNSFWQWTNQPVEFPGDQDVFNGTQDDLVGLANGTQPPAPQPPPVPPPPPPPPPPAVICRVPRVIGMRLANARARIRGAHCSPGRVRRVRAKRPGRVFGQKPRAGSRRPLGARVSLQVARKRH
jgi:GH25 family lysozyme M1 (1,4-beta-N-acetylmuramidase)